MTDLATYGHAELLMTVEAAKIWITPVVALGPKLVVSLVIEGDSSVATDLSTRPAVSLAAIDPAGQWVPCPSLGGGGGGTEAFQMQYATFGRPEPELSWQVRVEVRYRDQVGVRRMAIVDVDEDVEED